MDLIKDLFKRVLTSGEDIFKDHGPINLHGVEMKHSYVFTADQAYPVWIASLREAVRKGQLPGGALDNYYVAAVRLTDDDWRLARPVPDLDKMPLDLRSRRANVLELARLWGTEQLAVASGDESKFIKILAGSGHWKL